MVRHARPPVAARRLGSEAANLKVQISTLDGVLRLEGFKLGLNTASSSNLRLKPATAVASVKRSAIMPF
jgi:hypothetical protein